MRRPPTRRIISRAIVSNTPAYPKKLPIVLIATLATLLLSTGLIVDGRIAAHDRAAASLVAASAPPSREPELEQRRRAPAVAGQPRRSRPRRANELEQLAETLCDAGRRPRRSACSAPRRRSASP